MKFSPLADRLNLEDKMELRVGKKCVTPYSFCDPFEFQPFVSKEFMGTQTKICRSRALLFDVKFVFVLGMHICYLLRNVQISTL